MTDEKKNSPAREECLSMTGYAQARRDVNGWALRLSVKSVNHRFLDLKLRLPEGFDPYELRLRQLVRERIHRGHVDVQLSVEPRAAAQRSNRSPRSRNASRNYIRASSFGSRT